MNFPCVQCGHCCRMFKAAPVLEQYGDAEGVCPHLAGNLCSIYGDRPLVCNTEEMYQAFFKTRMTEEAFVIANLKACQQIAEGFQDSITVQKIEALLAGAV